MNVREIPRKDISKVLNYSWVDHERKPWVYKDIAYIPVRDGFPCTCSLPERKRKGRGYQRIGPIIAFHGEEPTRNIIDEVIKSHHPQAVIWYRSHQGTMRIPDSVILFGEVTDVIHKESGIQYYLNPGKVMFSQGNHKEKMRVASLVKPGEQVCDMFAGIGYFTLPLAKAGARVHAIEINPDAVQYLKINAGKNNLRSRIIITQGDCRDHLAGPYDRIHMGYYEADTFLSCALEHVRSGTTLHVHGIGDNQEKIYHDLNDSGLEGSLYHRSIKKIGPGKVHTVTDVVIA